MIDLLSVKLKNANNYRHVQDTVPITDGTWLSTADFNEGGTDYFKGYSYIVDTAAPSVTRIESDLDERILTEIEPAIERTVEYLYNYFEIFRNNTVTLTWNSFLGSRLTQQQRCDFYSNLAYYITNGEYASATITYTDEDLYNAEELKVGDLVQLKGTSRNNGYKYISTIDTTTTPGSTIITFDNTTFTDLTELETLMNLMVLPPEIESAINSMIWFDVSGERNIDSNPMTSFTKVGNTSWKKGTFKDGDFVQIGGKTYPVEVVGNLNNWKNVRSS